MAMKDSIGSVGSEVQGEGLSSLRKKKPLFSAARRNARCSRVSRSAEAIDSDDSCLASIAGRAKKSIRP